MRFLPFTNSPRRSDRADAVVTGAGSGRASGVAYDVSDEHQVGELAESG